ncbi:MAG: AEC family transporter [Trueperaceae bacterium]|nr:AEC family transporter [Trueperaceae bacterium]
MDAFITAVNATLPTFFLVALGAFSDRLFPNLSIETLSKLSVQVFTPALMFNALVGTSLSLSDASRLSFTYVIYLAALCFIAWLASFGLSTTQKRGVMATALFGNTGNMGLPITLFAYGQAGLERAVIIFVISIIAMFAIGPTILSGSGESLGKRFWSAIKLPPFWATIIGVLFNVLRFPVPEVAARSIALLGGAAIPVMLISLGIQMRRSWVWDIGGAAIRTTLIRLGVGPFLAFGLATVIGLAPLDARVLILSAAMPAAVTMFVVAVEVKGDYAGVARSVVATTIASLFVIMAVIYFFPA